MTAAVTASTSASDKEASADKTAARGLKGIIAADTKICDVDGDLGKLEGPASFFGQPFLLLKQQFGNARTNYAQTDHTNF